MTGLDFCNGFICFGDLWAGVGVQEAAGAGVGEPEQVGGVEVSGEL